MSFLDKYSSDLLSVRITKKGRNSIAKGNFNISYFQIGDSEYDYNTPFNQMDGQHGAPSQKIFSPFDYNDSIKYPYQLDDSVSGTTYGNPIQNSETITLRNVMGPAGFVSDYLPLDGSSSNIKCYSVKVDYGYLDSGDDTITINPATWSGFTIGDYVTIVYHELNNDGSITGQTNSIICQVINIDSSTITFDKMLPDLSAFTDTGNVEIIKNKCSIDYVSGCTPTYVIPEDQHDPWTLNVLWGENPIGYTQSTNGNLTGFTSNVYVSTKQLLGYTTSSGQTNNTTTSYVNSFGETITVTPEEQRCIAVIHYSELGDSIVDPERYYKYDDYISTDDNLSNSLYTDFDDNVLTDTEYFEVYIPFLLYDRNINPTLGSRFFMDTVDYSITTPSTIFQGCSSLKYRYLIDEQNVRVGKVFYENRTIVFDDQEIVATLEPNFNRKYTLPAPKLSLTPSDQIASDSILSGTTGQTLWVTYKFITDVIDMSPCNYYTKIDGITMPTNVSVKFGPNSFKYLGLDYRTEYNAVEFYILAQLTSGNEKPSPDSWIKMDYTDKVTNITGSTYPFLNSIDIVNKSFIITKEKYDNGDIFNISSYLTGDINNFGNEQPFPGSIRLVRASDIEEMNYSINLPSSQFTETQNPTYTSGDKKITEVTLLDSNKEVLIVGKTSVPITRSGTQVLQVRLDF